MANDKLTLDVVQAAELKYAFERTGWNNAEIKALSSGDVLAGVRDVIRGFAKIEHIKYIIDCDADPFVPEG
ncbi:MAG TPA: hypothetical protein VEK36_01775, partial [Candidatus Paceibacterota bacterium]|nr:hypothetical protein [Candidatus Paceibacterota bacterium]